MTERSEASPRVLEAIVDRWSPRSFDEGAVPQEDLDVIFEAAGWAPSAFNLQPWRFLYAHRGDANWERFLSLLIDFNQSWAKDASVLVFVVSDTLQRKDDGRTSANHSHLDSILGIPTRKRIQHVQSLAGVQIVDRSLSVDTKGAFFQTDIDSSPPDVVR